MPDCLPTVQQSRFLASNLSSPLLGSSRLAGVTGNELLDGLDLDTTGSLRMRLQRWQRAQSSELDAVGAIWVEPSATDLDPASLLGRLASRTGFDRSCRIFVIDTDDRFEPGAVNRQLSAAIRLRRHLPTSDRVALAVRPFRIESTRSHLNGLSAMRLQASEWDLDLALDLARGLDWLWEAEAAVFRMMPSLRLIRMSFPTQTFDGRFRTSLTERAVAAAADLSFGGAFSLVAPLPVWHWRNASALEAACKEAATATMRRVSARRLDLATERDLTRELDRD